MTGVLIEAIEVEIEMCSRSGTASTRFAVNVLEIKTTTAKDNLSLQAMEP